MMTRLKTSCKVNLVQHLASKAQDVSLVGGEKKMHMHLKIIFRHIVSSKYVDIY